MHWSFLHKEDQCILVKTSPRLSACYLAGTEEPIAVRYHIHVNYANMCTHSFCIHTCTYHRFSIVPLQTRHALNEEVTKQGLNIIHSASFPTDKNPQPFVQKLQVGDWNEMNIMIMLLNNMNLNCLVVVISACIGIKWKDYFLKLLPEVCTRDSLPGMC